MSIGSMQVVHGQEANNSARARTLHGNLNRYLLQTQSGLYLETTDRSENDNPHSWLWPLCALIQGVNELEVIDPDKEYMAPVERAIERYYNDDKPAPAYQDYVRSERWSHRFFDDNQWIAIAYLDAYNRSKEQRYLDKAKMIYKFMMTGLDSVTGGGIYWKERDSTTKNTCSNGPGILVALKLYQATAEKEYLSSALDLYKWTNSLLKGEDGTYYDAVKIPSGRIDKTRYTYNTGTMLESNVLLYKLTRKVDYLKEAQGIALAGRKRFFVNGKLPGHYWFNAVMLRGYQELYSVDQDQKWIDFYKVEADRIWMQERDSRGLVGENATKSLIDQAGMLEIFARLAQLEAKKQ